MVTVLLWALFLGVAEGYGVGGRGSCEHRGKRIPFGVVQTFDNCEYCLCTAAGVVQCQNFVSSDCSAFNTDCDAPFTPFGECCPRCHSETEPEFAHYSGFGNNVGNPMSGAVGSKLIRLSPPAYGDGFGTPRELATNGNALPNAREVSNKLGDTDDNPDLANFVAGPEDRRGLTCWFWQWGQFIDHDFTLVTEVTDAHAEEFGIHVPAGDVYEAGGTSELHFARANWDRNTGTGPGNWRGHVNSISTAIDGSNVYGSDAYTNYLLRGGANSQDGLLRMHDTPDSEGADLLPLNNGDSGVGINMAAMPDGTVNHFAAGDFRANEQQLLTTIHTLWAREHNRWAVEMKTKSLDEGLNWDDERIFQEARKFVRAEMQIITYDEWLPAVLGTTLQPYGGYQPNIPMAMSTEFVGSFFRMGHTAIRDTYAHIDANGNLTPFNLRDLFFDAAPFLDNGFSVAGFARGLSQCRAQEIDTKMVDALRLHLFDGVNDLLALNVQRARDMGIPGINDIRRSLSLAPHANWASVTSDSTVQTALASVYDNVEDCDSWICAMAEDKKYGSVGETLGTVLIDQFARLRDGDRFWWENALTEEEQDKVRDFRLADLLEENGVSGTKAAAGPDLKSLFLASNNNYFSAADISDVPCSDMTPQTCPHSNGFSYPQDSGDNTCSGYQPCLCYECPPGDARWSGSRVCGSDSKTYSSECELIEAACQRTNLQMVHKGKCFDEGETIVLQIGYHAGEIDVSPFGVPSRLRVPVPRLPGGGNAQRWEVHFVTNCDTKTRMNPRASPEAPIPSEVSNKNANCDGNDCELRARLLLGTRVATDDVKFLQTMECDSDDSFHTSGLLGSSILVKPEGEDDNHAEAQCNIISGAPFVQLQAKLRTRDHNNEADKRIANLDIYGDINQRGPGTVQLELREDNNHPDGHAPFVDHDYSFYLTNEPCGQTTWTHFNYGQDGHGETPPLLSFSIDEALSHELKFVAVNPYLRVLGKNTPVGRWVRVVSHLDSSVLACGKVNVVADYEQTDCLIDNTANGGRGQSLYRSFRESGGFQVNLADSEQQTQGSTQNTNASEQQTFGGGGMASGTGILMIMVALVVVLLIALIFVVIVLYVRSNPYTAPSALKKVGSLAGDPRPSAQVVN